MLIAIDGIDGCGKSTQAILASAELGIPLQVEPARDGFGAVFREGGHPWYTQLSLIIADRASRIENYRRTSSSDSCHVIYDRSFLSSAAYQTYGKTGLSPENVVDMHLAFMPRYDLIIVLDVVVKEALARISNRGRSDGLSYFESKSRLNWCRNVYLDLADRMENVKVVSGSGGQAVVHELIMNSIGSVIPTPSSRHAM